MAKHTLSEWFIATRYWSFAVSLAPVIVTFAYICSKGLLPNGSAPIVNLLIALLAVMVLHSAGNVMSDYFDYKKGVDNKDAFAVPNLVFGKFAPGEYLTFSIILFVVGAALGIFLVVRTGLPLLLIGMAGVLLTMLYSLLKYNALGDLDIFLIFAVLEILGSAYVIAGEMVWDALVLALPVGIITISVLHANNTVDTQSDGMAGITTLAMVIGAKASCALYRAYMVIPFLCVIISVIAGWLHPMALISMLAIIPAAKNFKAASAYNEKGTLALSGLDKASASLQSVFSTLLALGLFASCLF